MRISPYFIPSYLDYMDGTNDFQHFADSMMHIGPLRIRTIRHEPYTVSVADVDWCLRFDNFATVYIPKEEDFRVPPGTQIAVMNNSDQRVIIRGIGDVMIGGPNHPMIDKWKVGVLVKYNANFWLLSLGSGAAGGPATPSPPTLTTATAGNRAVTLVWTAPTDDGGSPITGYQVEYSRDEKDWAAGPGTAADVLTATVTGLSPGNWSFRVRAINEAGDSDPSNILTASPRMDAPEVTHTAYGIFKVKDYDPSPSYQYIVTVNTGTASVDSNGNLISSAPTCQMTLKVKVGDSESPTLNVWRQQYTTHKENHRYQCGEEDCNCRRECNCHCGHDDPCDGGQSWGQCGCPGDMCWYNCHDVCDRCPKWCDNWVDVPDDYSPQGYRNEFGEWVKWGVQSGPPATPLEPPVDPYDPGVRIYSANGKPDKLYGFLPVNYDTKTKTPVPHGARVATLAFFQDEAVTGYYGADFDPDAFRLVWFSGPDKWGYVLDVEKPSWLRKGTNWQLQILNVDLETELLREGVVA